MSENQATVYSRHDLDYAQLIKRGRRFAPNPDHHRLRIAILADCSTQHLAALLPVISAARSLNVEIYEAAYDAIELEVRNPASELYRFAPDYIIILNTTAKLMAKLGKGRSPDVLFDEMTGIWESIASHSKASIIQSTFVQPLTQEFGNYGRMVDASSSRKALDLNARIVEAASKRHNVLINDVDFLASYVGRKHWVDEKIWIMAKVPCALEHLPLLARNIVDILAASVGKVVKCIVLDLDDTLWGGVIGDDGVEGIRLGDLGEGEAFTAFQRFLLSLKKRGIILAVCSKNDHHNAILPFRDHPEMVLKESDIAVFIANWQNKADNIRSIAKSLNIGLDSIVFLDDNPFERNLVRDLVPEVYVPEMPEDPALYIQALGGLNLFETTTFSKEDTERADMYRVEVQREENKAKFERVEDYLQSLSMEITCERFNAFNLPRVAQLMQRSNQFNLATRRYTEAECEHFMHDKGIYPFALSLADKFGSYGLISVVILKQQDDAIEIDEYLMSCRVLQRGVENFAMNHIFAHAQSRRCRRVIGRYIPTKKNAMVKDFYEQFGFQKISSADDGSTVWSCAVDEYKARPVHMTAHIKAE